MKWHPFAEKFPLIEGDEWTAFKESIRQSNGPDIPVVVRVVDGAEQGLDGRNRWKACEELGINCPKKTVDVPDDDVKAFILRHNVHRRHLTREMRQSIVAELRADGKSTRAIAESLGVNHSTVVRDIAHSGGAIAPPEAPPTVTGKDGKQYPATKPTPVQDEPDDDGEVPGDEEEATPPTPVQTPAKANGPPANTDKPIRCSNCERRNANNPDCQACKEARKGHRNGTHAEANGKHEPTTAPKPHRNGAPVFDNRVISDHLAKLVRLLNERAQALGLQRSPGYTDIRQRAEHLLAAWDRWQLEREAV